MTDFDEHGYPDWCDENAEWAFNRNTINQLGTIGKQLTEADYKVESGIDFNKKVGDDIPVKEFQEAINGLVLVADSKIDTNGYAKKVVIKTDASDDSILVQVGFNGSKIKLWNNGIIYDELFTKDELGKFSTLWDKINTNFLKNDIITPITDWDDKTEKLIDNAMQQFIKDGLKTGHVKKIRTEK